MKKVLAPIAVVLSLSLGIAGMPGWSTEVFAAVVTQSDVTAATMTAQAVIAATAQNTNAEVVAIRKYMQGLVAKAQKASTMPQQSLTDLVAALNEGARGLKTIAAASQKAASSVTATAGPAAADATAAGATAVGSTAAVAQTTAKAENKVAKATVTAEPVKTTAQKTTEAAKVAEVKADATEAKADVMAENLTNLVTLAVAQVANMESESVAEPESNEKSENREEDAEAEVPRTGEREDAMSTGALRGMGLVLGGAVVLAAAGAVLIVKRMKRGL